MAEMVNFNLANPYQAQLDALARRQQMADIMAQQAYQPMQAPGTYNGIQAPISHLSGLAKILEGYTAGKEERAIKEEKQKLGEEFRTTSAEQGRQFVDALRGTPAQTEIPVPSGEGYMGGEGVGPGRPYEPAKGPDLAKALQLSMGSVNPMVQSAGGSLLGAMMPKAAKWEAAKLEQPDGSVKTGWVDINSSNPASTFQIGGTKPPELEFKDTGGQIIAVNKATAIPVNVPAIPKVPSPDAQATLAQARELSDRAFNGLSTYQKEQLKIEGNRLGISAAQLFFDTGVRAGGAPSGVPVANAPTTSVSQPRTSSQGSSVPVLGANQPIQTPAGMVVPTGRTAQAAALEALKPPPKLTESEGNATAYGMRMQSAENTLQELAKTGNLRPAVISGMRLPLVGNVGQAAAQTLPSWLGGNSDEQQQVKQAKTNFITAVLRKESGATIGENEFKTEDEKYFPQVNDGPKTIEQKQKARELAIEAMKIQAGSGAKNILKKEDPLGIRGGAG